MNQPNPDQMRTALAALHAAASNNRTHWQHDNTTWPDVELLWREEPDGTIRAAIQRRHARPWSEDLELFAAALPARLTITETEPWGPEKILIIRLSCKTTSPATNDRCTRCNAATRYGTRLYGNRSLCAVCATAPDLPHHETGSALLIVLLLVTALGLVVSSAMMMGQIAERAYYSRLMVSQSAAGAASTVELMKERLASRVELRLGALDQADIDALNAETLPTPANATLDPSRSGYRVTAIRYATILPANANVLQTWTDHPRVAYAGIPPLPGRIAEQEIDVELRATASDAGGGIRTARQTITVTRSAAHDAALIVDGNADLCAETPGYISGPVRIWGNTTLAPCTATITYAGGIEARDAISAPSPGKHTIVGTDGSATVTSQTRATTEADPSTALAPWGGRLRVASGLGAPFAATPFQTASSAGSGECPDGIGACGGNGRFLPSITLQYRTPGPPITRLTQCGNAFPGNSCTPALAAAVSYRPWPFSSTPPAGTAATDPANPTLLWHGLLPDQRRENRCTATVAANTWRTLRCPSNAYGFSIDLAALPPLPGGLLSIRRANGVPATANPDGQREIVVLRRGTTLTAPLSIHSELPVYIVGSLNQTPQIAWNGPPPLMIDAPWITVLPAEADEQLGLAPTDVGWTSVWDSVPAEAAPTASALPITAERSVTIYAVLRSNYCRNGTTDYGGTWTGLPSVLGDWRAAALRIVGALEGRDQTASAPTGCPPPMQTTAWEPRSRELLYDDRLLSPSFAIPGSWTPANLPAGGASSSRTTTRQANATGASAALIARTNLRIGPPATLPAATAFTAPPPLPAPPAPLP